MSTHVPRKSVEAVDERDGLRDQWSGLMLGPGRNLHHRRLRSQGRDHRPGNLVTLGGSGTLGTHGFMHANPKDARYWGYIVPGWPTIDDPADIPIRITDRLGAKRWVLLGHTTQLIPLTDPAAEAIMRSTGIWV